MANVKHGKVKVKRDSDEKARTIPATLWANDNKPFQKQGYKLVEELRPVGIEAVAPAKPAKQPKQKAVEVEEQPEQNVEES